MTRQTTTNAIMHGSIQGGFFFFKIEGGKTSNGPLPVF